MSAPETPDTIYLFDMGPEGIAWCDDPAPGTGMDPADAVEYRRADLAPGIPGFSKEQVLAVATALAQMAADMEANGLGDFPEAITERDAAAMLRAAVGETT